MADERKVWVMGVSSLNWGLGLSVVVALGVATEAWAQIIPDETLGLNESIVVPQVNAPVDAIFGGAIRDQNLIHSFSEFNVDLGRGAYFFSPSPEIQTIFSRVTGTNQSNILGTLGTFGSSAPDLWLINPNGILFGSNASLDLGGSFFATTADAVQLEEFVVAAASEPPGSQEILIISNGVFLFDAISDAQIINQSQADSYAIESPLNGSESFVGLQVVEGNNIGLFGQDIKFDNSVLTAPNGNVVLSSINSIELENNASVVGRNVIVESNRISVQDGSRLLAQLIDIDRLGGNVRIAPGTFIVLDLDEVQDFPTVSGGNILVNARELLDITGTIPDEQFPSLIGSDAIGLLSSGGNVEIQTPSLIIQNGGQISSSYISFSDKNEGGGRISIEAADSVIVTGESLSGERSSRLFIGDSPFLSANLSPGSPSDGSILIQTEQFSLLNGAKIGARNTSQSTEPEGTQLIQNLIEISASNTIISGISPTGSSSNITTTINVLNQEDIPVFDFNQDGIPDNISIFEQKGIPVFITSDEIDLQQGGQIVGDASLQGENITLRNDASISGNTSLQGENITLRDDASISGNTISILGENIVLRDRSEVKVDEPGFGNEQAVDALISFQGDSITIQNDAQIVGDASLQGNLITIQNEASINGNKISFSGERIALIDQVEVRADEPDFGDGGTIDIATNFLSLRDSAQLSANVANTGNGGTISILPYGSIEGIGTVELIGDPKSDNPSSISATVGGPGNGGGILINTGSLTVQNGSQITTRINGGGTGGSINISAPQAVTIEGMSDNSRPSLISAETDLNGGEFGVLRHIRLNEESQDNIFLLLNQSFPVFVVGPSSVVINATQRDENLDLESIDPLPDTDTVLNSFGEQTALANEQQLNFEEIKSGQSGIVMRSFRISEEVLPFGVGLQRPPNSDEESDFLSDGLLLIGQSFSTDFENSISGAEVIRTLENRSNSEEYNSLFVSSLLEVENNSFKGELSSARQVVLPSSEEVLGDPNDIGGSNLIVASDIETGFVFQQFITPGQGESFFSNSLAESQALVSTDEIASIRESFEAGAGELYVVESTGDEFRIKDSTFTDTRFVNIQPGDLFLIFAVRDGGDIKIDTGNLTVRNGAQISTNSLGAAQGGAAASNLSIEADSVLVENNSSISAAASTGSGGNILVQSSNLRLNNDATLTAEARDNAGGGNITLNISGDVQAINSDILANSAQTTGGTIAINANDIRLEGDSDIRTNVAAGDGEGGDINLTGRYIFAFDDSDILANAKDGRGGDINFDVRGFFGENFTLDSLNADPDTLDGNARVDVNATGAVNGVVTIPDISFIENSLSDLSDTIISPDQILTASCISRANEDQGTFNVTGSGGLPTSPNSDILSTYPTSSIQSPTETTSQWQLGDPINEATGVSKLADGRLVTAKDCNSRK